jgi:hypothetical protein
MNSGRKRKWGYELKELLKIALSNLFASAKHMRRRKYLNRLGDEYVVKRRMNTKREKESGTLGWRSGEEEPVGGMISH